MSDIISQISDKEKLQIYVWTLKAAFWVFSSLGAAFVGLLMFMGKSVLSQLKAYREERSAHDRATIGKFESINTYMHETDKVQAMHQMSIKELQKITDRHEKKLDKS